MTEQNSKNLHLPTGEEIEAARDNLAQTGVYLEKGGYLSSNGDGVRACYRFLAFQKRIKTKPRWTTARKGLVERWAGFYVSTDDFVTAAHMLGIEGSYLDYKLSVKMLPVPRDGLACFGLHRCYFEQDSFVVEREKRLFDSAWRDAVISILKKHSKKEEK